MKKLTRFLCYGLVLMLIGCAGAQKAELASPEDLALAVAEVEGLKKAADIDQAELLSFKEYSKGSRLLEKAQRGLANGREAEYIRENASRAKAQLQLALDNTSDRTANALRILVARKSVLDAGSNNSQALVEALAKVDKDIRNETDSFERDLDPAEFSEFQKRYFDLEVRAVQFRELDAVNKAIQNAASQDAEDLAPDALRTAMLDVSEANNLIAQVPRNPGAYQAMVDLAVESSVFLTEVMDVILNAKGTPEPVAVKIVEQNRKLAALSENVGALELNLKSTQSTLMETEGTLKQKDQELESTRSSLQETESALLLQNQQLEQTSMQVRFQRAMDEAVKQFSDEEASVYQQGSKLIFRLKKMNFASGSAAIPAASKPLLAKINDIITTVGAELVAVQGHTDSVGAADLNKSLSTKRAVSVANYLASLKGGYKIGYIGYGESRPIASNETPAGRAINRRVDLVVTAKK